MSMYDISDISVGYRSNVYSETGSVTLAQRVSQEDMNELIELGVVTVRHWKNDPGHEIYAFCTVDDEALRKALAHVRASKRK